MHIAVFQDLRPGEQIRLHLAGHREGGRLQAARGNRAEIKGLGRAARRHDLREANAAQATIPGLQRRQRKGCRHRRIGGRASSLQNGDTRLSCAARLGCHHALAARGCGLRDMPMLGSVSRRGPGHDRVSSSFCTPSLAPAGRSGKPPPVCPAAPFLLRERSMIQGRAVASAPFCGERLDVCIKGAFCCPHSEEFH